MELMPDVHRIEAQVGGRPLYLFAFLGKRRLLLDAGCASTGDECIVPCLDRLGLGVGDFDLLAVTHSDLDHQGGVHALKRANRDYVEHLDRLVRSTLEEPLTERVADGRVTYRVSK
ncbi:MAG: hypothetical protein M3018_01100 [Actinomycetota bacterium]|nr:hypothetical protein [Actinomycetota bacterium]